MMSRQAGKNELSAHIEAYLLNLHAGIGGAIVKAAPTYVPQLATSRLRLESTLENPLNHGQWHREQGGVVRLGRARCQFLSAEPAANVVGATASIALEIDEVQDVEADKHDRDFAPMAASTNATRVYYGTAWRGDDLLQRVRAETLGAPLREGRRRDFTFPWWIVAEANPAYGAFVESEQRRLGDDHPLFKTQYRLETLGGEGGMFSTSQRLSMRGDHSRLSEPILGECYVAGIDVAGADEALGGADPRGSRRDATVITIARVRPIEIVPGIVEPRVEIVEHLWWVGRDQRSQYEALVHSLRDIWRVRAVAIDASGIGAGLSDFLRAALGDVVRPFVFTAESKSRLGFGLIAAINGGRLRMHDGRDPEATETAAEFWREFEHCRSTPTANRGLRFGVPEAEGHDDFVISAALCVWAARDAVATPVAAIAPVQSTYTDGRF
jgi:hypothetical protein